MTDKNAKTNEATEAAQLVAERLADSYGIVDRDCHDLIVLEPMNLKTRLDAIADQWVECAFLERTDGADLVHRITKLEECARALHVDLGRRGWLRRIQFVQIPIDSNIDPNAIWGSHAADGVFVRVVTSAYRSGAYDGPESTLWTIDLMARFNL